MKDRPGAKRQTFKPPQPKRAGPDVEVVDDAQVDAFELEDSEDSSDSEEIPEVEVKDSKALVPFDSFHAYLSEIKRYPRLTKEREHELAVKYYEQQDLKAAYKLVKANLWLVVKIARDYERAARSLLDLIQEGNIGLMEAVKNFDPYRGTRFPSYAVWWIKAYIMRYVLANWRMVKIGTTQAQRKLFYNLKKEKERLEREGIWPEPKLLAENLNVKESELIEMEQRLSAPDLSVDAPIQEDSEESLHAILASGDPNVQDLLEKRELASLVELSFKEFRSGLSERDCAIFDERLLAEKKSTLQDLAERFKLSKEGVRLIENKLKSQLKGFLVEKLGEATIEDLS